nr:60S ribosomal protein L14-2 [Ipomoea batatas]
MLSSNYQKIATFPSSHDGDSRDLSGFGDRCKFLQNDKRNVLVFGRGFEMMVVKLTLYSSDDPFKRYVEIGRVALVNYGKDYGKLVVIVDVIDQNRALVDAPDMVRSQMNFKRLTLTDITIDIKRVPKKKTLIAAMEAADVKNKWENSSWGRKLIVQKRRASLNDFDRFKIMLAKIKKAGIVRQELAKLKKESTA